MSAPSEQSPADGPADQSPGVAQEIARWRRRQRRKRIRGVLYGAVIAGTLFGLGLGAGSDWAFALGFLFTVFYLAVVWARISNHREESRRVRTLLREYPWVEVRYTVARVEHEDGFELEGLRLLRADGSTLLELTTPWSADVRQRVRESGAARLWCAGDPATGAVVALPGGVDAFLYTPEAEPGRALSAAEAGHDPAAGVPAGIDPDGFELPARRGVRFARLAALNAVVLVVLAVVGGRAAGSDRTLWDYLAAPLVFALPAILFLGVPLVVPTVRVDGYGITRTTARGKVSRLAWGQIRDIEFNGTDLTAYLREPTAAGWRVSPTAGGRVGTLVTRERGGMSAREREARRTALTRALPYFAWTVARADVSIGATGRAPARPGAPG
jgi:hypothetical protein